MPIAEVNTNLGKFPDLIFVSLEDWDEVWRRNQFLVAGLARRYPQSKFLFVGLARDVSHQVRRGRLTGLRGEEDWSPPDLPNVTVTRAIKLLPNTLAAGRGVNERLMRRHVRVVAARLGLRDPLLWLNPHSAVHMAGRMGERAVVYDITDDWSTLPQPEPVRRLIERQDAALCRRADAVIVCSQRLWDLKRDLARNLQLVPNGVDAAHYRLVLDGTAPLPKEAMAWPKPVLGYTGTVHPSRVDVALVEALAHGWQEGTIVLIGPDHLPPTERARMDRLGNVVRFGPAPYSRLPEFMRAFDVCITPHLVTPFTESLNPLKLWEFLAAGKPVVSTNVAGFRDYPQFVRIASTADEFLAAARDALSEDPALPEARREEARQHSWEARLDAIEAILAPLGLVTRHE